jgi:cytochrome c biogenesis protein CcmG/thiol:disulfide interchange protein DsbE
MLHDANKQFSPQDMKGQVWLLNVWASWCGACKDEHPVLMELARQNIVPIVGLDYKDKREDGEQTLRKAGDPYSMVIADADGKVGFDYGVYGVPETYLIDKQGVIQYKLIGAVTTQNLRDTILPMVKELQAK